MQIFSLGRGGGGGGGQLELLDQPPSPTTHVKDVIGQQNRSSQLYVSVENNFVSHSFKVYIRSFCE